MFDLDICPLDLIMFAGSGVVSRIIKITSDMHTGYDRFTHVGIVVSRELLPFVTEMEPNKLYVLESIMSSSWLPETDGVPNIEDKYTFGVQIRELEPVIRAYISANGKESVTWGKVANSPWRQGNKSRAKRAVKDAYKLYGDAPYDITGTAYAITPYWMHRYMRACSCMRSELHNVLDDADVPPRLTSLLDPNAQFCSELAANIYQRLGLIDTSLDARKFTPVEIVFGLHDRPEAVRLDVSELIDVDVGDK